MKKALIKIEGESFYWEEENLAFMDLLRLANMTNKPSYTAKVQLHKKGDIQNLSLTKDSEVMDVSEFLTDDSSEYAKLYIKVHFTPGGGVS